MAKKHNKVSAFKISHGAKLPTGPKGRVRGKRVNVRKAARAKRIG